MKTSNIILAILGVATGVVVLLFGLSLIFSLPVMWLWNWLMPSLFGLTKVTWLQAWGLLFLSGLLFKSSTHSKSD